MRWSGKKVLITGGAGFIGSHLARDLLKENAEIIILDNFSSGKRENVPSNCKVIEADAADKKSLDKIKDIDYAFHFGAPPSVVLFNKNPEVCVHSTVCGFLNILEWGKRIGIKKLIYPSSGSVYGNTSLPQSEDMQPKPANLYGICKLTCELVAKKYSEEVPSVGLRIFAGYGPGEEHKGDFASVITLFLYSIARGKPPIVYGDGTQSRDFVYIDDVVKSIRASAERNVKNEIINVGSGKAHTFNEVVNLINRLLNKNVKPVYINKPPNYLENTLADIRKMKQVLNVKPLDLENGLKEYLTHFSLIRI